jgi:Tfp pilus assembly protein PilF
MNTDKKPVDPGLLEGSIGSSEGAAGGCTSPKGSGRQNPFSSVFIGVHRWLVPLALAVVTLAVYWPVRNHLFINYDDPVYVTENRHVQAGISGRGLAWAFFNLHGEHTYWHPVTWVSHMLDCQLFGLSPGPHHLVNVAFHVANALLLLVVLRRMTGAFWRSAMVAGLFALHPLQVDTVAWVTERKNVLSTLFWLLTVWAYVRYAEGHSPTSIVQRLKSEGRSPKAERNPRAEVRSPKPEARVPWSVVCCPRSLSHLPSSVFYFLSLSLFALGLMCKPALVTLPFALLLLDYWPLGRMQNEECRMKKGSVRSPVSRITFPVSRLTLLLEKLPFLALAGAAAFVTLAGHHEIRAEGTAGLAWQWRVANALVSYVRYLGKTFWPSHLAVFYPHPGVWPVEVVGGSVLILLAVSGFVIWRARQAPYLVTGWLWFLGVLVPMIGIIQAGVQAMADRFAYVPLIGLFIMIVWGLGDWAERGVRRSADLQSAASRISNPQSPGEVSRAGRLQTCDTADCKSALRGRWLREYGTFGLAALALAGCALLTSRQLSYWQNTTTLFEHALQVTRNNSCAHFSLGNELADRGKTQQAMTEWEAAVEIEPGRADIHGRIAGSLSRQGDFTGAIERYRRALQIDPDHAEVLNNLAWLLATCPEASQRSGPEAVQLALKACKLTRMRRTVMVGTLAAAYAEAGRFAEAGAMAQKACALATEEGDGALLERNQQLLDLYRAGKPYHETALRQVEF